MKARNLLKLPAVPWPWPRAYRDSDQVAWFSRGKKTRQESGNRGLKLTLKLREIRTYSLYEITGMTIIALDDLTGGDGMLKVTHAVTQDGFTIHRLTL